MLKIAICDSDIEYAKASAEIWSRVYFDTEDVVFRFYTTGSELIEDMLAQNFRQDILILDLLLPDISGVKLMQFIRQTDKDVTLVLQTEAEDLARIGYRYRVFDFIVKHTSIREIERVANRYLQEKIHTQEGILEVSVQGSPQRLRLDGIIFFESDARKIQAFGPDEDTSFYMKMDELEQQLADKGFLRCHQSYLVNSRYIKSCTSGMLTLVNKNMIPVSRRYQADIRNFLARRRIEEEQAL